MKNEHIKHWTITKRDKVFYLCNQATYADRRKSTASPHLLNCKNCLRAIANDSTLLDKKAILILSKEERDEIDKLHSRAQNTPVILIGGIGTKDAATRAWDEFRAYLTELGEKHGYDASNVSINPDTGEVVPT